MMWLLCELAQIDKSKYNAVSIIMCIKLQSLKKLLVLISFLVNGVAYATQCPELLGAPAVAAPIAARTVVVVNAVSSTSRSVVEGIRRRGFIPIHILSDQGLLRHYPDNSELFDQNLQFRDREDLNRQLTALNPMAIIPGSETGVPLAEQLAQSLGLRTNAPESNSARIDKHRMQEALRKDGLSYIQQIKTADDSQAIEWVKRENHGKFPVVVKPLASSGTEGFVLCENEQDVRVAFKALGTTARNGKVLEELLVQEFLEGTEYAFNVVVRDGEFLVTDIWEYIKKTVHKSGGGQSRIYDYNKLLDFKGDLQDTLLAYVKEVIRVLGIENGAAHFEIIITNRGPVLVEVGARLMGGSNYILVEKAVAVSPVELFLDAYLEPDRLTERLRQGPLSLVGSLHARTVKLISPVSGKLKPGVMEKLEGMLRAHPCAVATNIGKLKAGGKVSKTIDLSTSPGEVLLLSGNPNEIETAYRAIRQLEAEGLYQVE